MLSPLGGLFQRDLEVIAEIAATRRAISSPTTATEEIAEDVAEVAEDVLGSWTARESAHPRVTKAVVAGALVAVGQDLIGLRGLLEALLSVGVVWVPIRVVLQRELAEGLLQGRRIGALIDP